MFFKIIAMFKNLLLRMTTMKVTPGDTGPKLNLHNTFIRQRRCQIKLLSTFYLIIM